MLSVPVGTGLEKIGGHDRKTVIQGTRDELDTDREAVFGELARHSNGWQAAEAGDSVRLHAVVTAWARQRIFLLFLRWCWR